MQHVVTAHTPILRGADGQLVIHTVPAWKDNLIWVIASSGSDEAWAVDGPDAEAVLAWCAGNGRRLVGILNTHTHHDHVGINHDLQRRGLLEGMRVFGREKAGNDVPGLTDPVDEGDRFDLAGVPVRVLRTEGHIDGHVSYVIGDLLFCGDTLFAGGCGYLFDGPPSKMFDSLLRLAALDPGTRVCCAHEYTQDNLRFAWMVEPDNEALAARIRQVWRDRADGRCTVPSTIAEERATNPFLRPGSPTLRANVAAHMPGVALDTDLDVFTATRALKDKGLHKGITDEDLPLEA